jgi:hypothetical protein
MKTGSMNRKGGEKKLLNRAVIVPIRNPSIKTAATDNQIGKEKSWMNFAANTFNIQITPPKERSSPAGIKYSIAPKTIMEKMEPHTKISRRFAPV